MSIIQDSDIGIVYREKTDIDVICCCCNAIVNNICNGSFQRVSNRSG